MNIVALIIDCRVKSSRSWSFLSSLSTLWWSQHPLCCLRWWTGSRSLRRSSKSRSAIFHCHFVHFFCGGGRGGGEQFYRCEIKCMRFPDLRVSITQFVYCICDDDYC